MLKRIALTGLTIATVLGGARLTLAAFAPVLPPGFAAWTDESYDEVHGFVRWMAIEQFEHLQEHGRWGRSLVELLPWAHDEYAAELDLELASRGDSVYVSARSRDGRYSCRLATDGEHARAYTAQPNWRRWRWAGAERSALAIHSRMDCRRATWPWTWTGTTGIGRLDAPPQRYSSLDYVDRATDTNE